MAENYAVLDGDTTLIHFNFSTTTANNTLFTASSIGQIRGIFSGVFILFYVLVISHLIRKWVPTSKTSKTRLQWAVIATSFFGLVLQIISFVEFIFVYIVLDLERASKICHSTMLLSTDWFILSSVSSYVVMYFRSSAVLQKVDSSKWVKYLQLFVGMSTCTCPTLLILVRVMDIYSGTLLVDHNGKKFCTTGLSAVLNLLFVLMDSSVSAGYLILFLYPLNISPDMFIRTGSSTISWKFSTGPLGGGTNSSYSKAQQTIIKVARTNLKWSLLTVGVTFVAIGIGAIASFQADALGPLISSDITSLYIFLATTIDPLVKTLSAMAITNKLPDWLQLSRKSIKVATQSNSKNTPVQKLGGLFESEENPSSEHMKTNLQP